MDYGTYYASIVKPWFAPEPWVFGFAWGFIYPLIILAGIYIFYLYFKDRLPKKNLVLGVFGINIVANLAFTPLQLQFPGTIYATLDILVVLITVAYLAYYFFKENQAIFLLLLPYLLWGAFATMLQVSIYYLNYV